jgi:hypothetical protein
MLWYFNEIFDGLNRVRALDPTDPSCAGPG